MNSKKQNGLEISPAPADTVPGEHIPWAAWLSAHLGLDTRTVGHERLEHVLACMSSEKGLTEAGFQRLLARCPEARRELYDAIVIPETWFMRGRASLEAAAAHALGNWRPSAAHRVLRLLSIPCCTGEEPYSLAILLRQRGFPSTHFRIDAIDLSEKAIERARRAQYQSHSFRKIDPDILRTYFIRQDKLYAVNPELRENVHFQTGNVADPDFLQHTEPYDLIFCRNLLIYLTETARECLLRHLQRLLRPTGRLFVGHAETGIMRQYAWTMQDIPQAFCFTHPHTGKPHNTAPSPVPVQTRRPPPPPLPRPPPLRPPTVKPTPPAPPEAAPLKRARQLADSGQLDQAEASCRELLQQQPLNADVFFLAGLIATARSDDENARKYFEKALYLNAVHAEALLHLSLLHARRGHKEKAARYERRLRNLPLVSISG